MDYFLARSGNGQLAPRHDGYMQATACARSNRESRGEKFLRVCATPPSSEGDKAVLATLDQLYEESDKVVEYRGTFNVNGVHAAAKGGNVACLSWLLNHSADFTLSTQPKLQNAAHIAAQHGHIDALAWMIEHGRAHGVDFMAKDAKGRTPEALAKLYNRTQAVKCIQSMTFLQTLPRQRCNDGNAHTMERLSQLDLVLELQNLKSVYDEEVASRKKRHDETFMEISQLKEEVRDLKQIVRSLVAHLKGADGEKMSIADKILGQSLNEEANALIAQTNSDDDVEGQSTDTHPAQASKK